jgi:hypothetical protein
MIVTVVQPDKCVPSKKYILFVLALPLQAESRALRMDLYPIQKQDR